MNLHEVLLASRIAGKNNVNGESADLSDYYTKSQTDSLISGKVNKINGMGLSQNSFTDAEKEKLSGLKNYDDTDVKADVSELASQAAINKFTLGYQTKNLLENLAVGKTLNGLTFTVNADKSVTLNGTLQSGKTSSFYLNEDLVLPKTVLKKTRGFLIGAFSKSTGSWLATPVNTNTDTFDASDFDYDNCFYKANIQRSDGAVYDDVVVYPMIYLPDMADDTYEPYRPSVAEYIANLEARIATLESVNLQSDSLNSSLNTTKIDKAEEEN